MIALIILKKNEIWNSLMIVLYIVGVYYIFIEFIFNWILENSISILIFYKSAIFNRVGVQYTDININIDHGSSHITINDIFKYFPIEYRMVDMNTPHRYSIYKIFLSKTNLQLFAFLVRDHIHHSVVINDTHFMLSNISFVLIENFFFHL